MRHRLAIVYNRPLPSRYNRSHEEKAVLGVLPCVTAVHRALIGLGHFVNVVSLAPPCEQVKNVLSSLDVDVVFNLFEGFPGEAQTEAIVPEILSELGMPYTGCSGAVLRLALDKARVKKMLLADGIPTPDFQLLSPQKMGIFRLKYPCIVKPVGEDASHGITAESVVYDYPALQKRVKMISEAYDEQALVEEYIDGREFNVTVMGNTHFTVLPVSEIVYSLPPDMPPILTYEAKWEPDSVYYQGTKPVCPAKVTHKIQTSIHDTALAAYRLLGCSGYARVDMRMSKTGKINIIEVNPNPDISPDAGAARQAAAAGMSYLKFIEKIVKLALEKKHHGRENQKNERRRQTGVDSYSKAHA